AHGRPRWDVPMLYVFGFFFIFALGGLTGVMLAIVPLNWQAHDTYFVVAHMHYVVAGALAFPMLAAFYYWLPLLTGRTAVHRLAVPAFWLGFIGFKPTFFLIPPGRPLGMPRRPYTYRGDVGWNWLNLLSSVGGFIMTIGFGLVVIDVLAQFRYGRRVRRDPWQAPTLEWAMPLPPAPYAFASLPRLWTPGDEMPAGKLALSLARGEGYRGVSRNRWAGAAGRVGAAGGAHALGDARTGDHPATPDLPAALYRARHGRGGPDDARRLLRPVAGRGAPDRLPVRAGRPERRARTRLRTIAGWPRPQPAAAH